MSTPMAKVLRLTAVLLINMTLAAFGQTPQSPALRPNALRTVAGIYPASQTPSGLVVYRTESSDVIAESAIAELWRTQIAGGVPINGLSGGLDANSDGYPEVIAVHAGLSPETLCNGVSVDSSQISIVDGKTGKLHYSLKLPNCAQAYAAGPFRYQQLSAGSVLFGTGPDIYVTRQYENQGWAMRFGDGRFRNIGTSVFPSTSTFGGTYSNAATVYNGTTQIQGSHAANGLVITVDGHSRVVFFTSGRVLQYALEDGTPLRLVSDTPFLSHQSTQDAYDDGNAFPCFDGCRNYGTVARVTVSGKQKILLISGATSSTLASDALSGNRAADIWGGLARHVNVFAPDTGVIETSRYYAYAYDPAQSRIHQYGGRVSVPAHPTVTLAGTTWLLYNVYGHVDGRDDTTPEDRWFVSVNKVHADGKLTENRIYDTFLWDICSDLSGSPVLIGTKTNGYFPEKAAGLFVTRLGLFSEEGTITWSSSVSGLPQMSSAFRREDLSSSSGYLVPVLVTQQGIETH